MKSDTCYECIHLEVCVYQQEFKFDNTDSIKIPKTPFTNRAFSCGHFVKVNKGGRLRVKE